MAIAAGSKIAHLDYRSAGVDVKLGNDVSKILYEAARRTWKNRKGILGEVVEVFRDFSGLRAIHVGGLPLGTYLSMNSDGVGTKIELAERRNKHDTVGFDLFGMVVEDATARKVVPVLVTSVLDFRSLGVKGEPYLDQVRQLAKGYVEAARAANVAVINGEAAELGTRVQGYGVFNYNWSATVAWIGKKRRMLKGNEIKVGDILVGLREYGFRSNGFSLVRKIMTLAHGAEWHMEHFRGTTLGDLALLPTRIYSPAVVEMFGGFSDPKKAEIHGIAHITGGGIPEKVGRMLRPSGLGADLKELFRPTELMLYCQSKGGVSDREAYSTWNMGQGMIIATPEPDKVIKVANEYGIDAKIVGEVRRKPGIIIGNQGLNRKQKELTF